MSPSALIEASSVAAVVTCPRMLDNPIVACNDAFLQLTGYMRADVIGRNCRFLVGPDTEAEGAAKLREAIRQRQPVLVELLNYRKDGTPFRNAVMIAPVFDADGELDYFLGSQMEVAMPASPGVPAGPDRVGALSQRQRQILVTMAAGRSNKQIAFELGVTERTVKMHRAVLFRRLGVRTSVEAIRIAIEAGY